MDAAFEALKDAAIIVIVLITPIGILYIIVVKNTGGKAARALQNRLRSGVEKTGFGRRMALRRTKRDAFRQRKAAAIETSTAAGNYRGLNPLLRARSAKNRLKSRALGKLANTEGKWVGGAARGAAAFLGGDTLAEDIIADRTGRSRERSVAMAEFGNNTALARAWVETGGGVNLSAGSYQSLLADAKGPDAEKARAARSTLAAFEQMQLGGRASSAESFLAGQELLAQEGEGNWQTLQAAQEYARRLGAAEVDIGGLTESSKSAWRKAGRGDIAQVGLDGAPGWGAIKPENLSRHALKDPDQIESFVKWFNNAAGPEKQQAFLAAYAKMGGREQQRFKDAYEKGYYDPATKATVTTAGNIVRGKVLKGDITEDMEALGIKFTA